MSESNLSIFLLFSKNNTTNVSNTEEVYILIRCDLEELRLAPHPYLYLHTTMGGIKKIVCMTPTPPPHLLFTMEIEKGLELSPAPPTEWS